MALTQVRTPQKQAVRTDKLTELSAKFKKKKEKKSRQLGVVNTFVIPVHRRQRQEDCHNVKATLGYIVNIRFYQKSIGESQPTTATKPLSQD